MLRCSKIEPPIEALYNFLLGGAITLIFMLLGVVGITQCLCGWRRGPWQLMQRPMETCVGLGEASKTKNKHLDNYYVEMSMWRLQILHCQMLSVLGQSWMPKPKWKMVFIISLNRIAHKNLGKYEFKDINPCCVEKWCLWFPC